GSVLLDTQNNGIVLGSNSNLNIVGGSRLTDYNVICGNEDFGVQLFGTQDSVLGNYFGLNDAGTLIAGHFQDYAVVLDSDASENQIGKEGGLIYGNIITNETDGGILIRNSASDNEVVGNYIGINDADTPLGLMDHGVLIQESAGDGNRIGRPVTGGGNIISNNNYGIIIDGADNQFVEHNRIGTNASGAGTVENFTTGIYIHNGAEGNTIGGSGDAGNLISGNAVYGVQIGGLGTDNNEVLGNIIGLNLALDAAIDNSIGIYIEDGASDNVIGKAGDFGNIICANELAGIIVDGTGTDDNLIFNNKIGPIFGNRHGVIIRSGASGTYLGGESIGEGNVVSNNDSTAIVLDNVNGNFVYGNKVGLTVVGSEALPNNIGIHVINSSANYIGNTGDYRGNVISANSMGGIIFDGSNSNFLYNNILGLDSAGLSDFTGGGNAFGVFLNNGSTNNQIGGSTSGQGNVVSGNNNFGIGFDGTTNNFVYGNYIGLNKDGSALYPNTLEGLILVNNASSNQIGGTEDGMINSIAGHFTNILLVNTDNVSIVNNNIGHNHLGDDTLSGAWTQSRGINLVAGSSSNTIQGNIISGLNQGVGIRLEGEGTDDNQIRSNRIGLTRSGDSRLNNREGIFVTDTASNNIIGGDDVANGNIISGNTLAHTAIEGEMTDGNVVKSNYFGLDPTGASSFNSTYGIGVFNEAENNRIEANYLADFDSVAIFLFDNSESTLIQGNSIGLSPSGSSLPGADTCGIYIDNAHNNVIGGTDPLMSNTITNCKKGIAIKGDGDENSILRNSIYDNSGLGIDLADDGLVNPIDGMLTAGGGNQNIDQPKILSAFACEDGGNIKVLFETNVPESVTYHFEFFQNSTASGQGETYINSFDVIPATNPDTIAFELGYPLAEGTEITMTASRLTFGSNGITSEFSEGFIIEASPDLEISTSDVSCGANNDGSIEVNSSGTFYSQLASNPADTINDQIIYESLGAGTYPLTISYPNGCVVGPTDVTINILDLTGVNAIDDQEVCIGSQVQLDAFGGTEYEWDEDDDLSELDVPDPVATVNEDKYFYVTITHDTGCEIRDSVYVSLLPLDQCNLIVYNSFTPNNDGLNDFFYIEGIEGYPENKVTFFNRWGDSILSIDNYDNDQNIWSGNKRDGNDAKEGTYFFVINVGGVQSQSGWVQLIR
ncbi:MAG: gliding motility-associated C-terminal domain-containing protein, partial [Flavobacteriales bacterium]|nr:gliding motility-associated C-terminal domain-containing protein [Flavobacteriales bacterium]